MHDHHDATPEPEAPVWVPALAVKAAHFDQLTEHGGHRGIRDAGVLAAVLARPLQRHRYEPGSDLATLAAAYAYGLAPGHAFVDGNKRVGHVTAGMFLALNGYTLAWASQAEIVTTMLAVAATELSESALAEVYRARLTPLGPDDA